MNQIEREYKNALDEVRFSQEAKERMMNNLMNQQEQAPVRRGSFRPLRAGLIAAAVCLALVGTAGAATAVYRLTVQTSEWEDFDNEYVGYHVYGEPVIHPLEDFSQKFQDDFTAWDHPSLLFHQEFDSPEEVEAYLGENISLVWHGMDDMDAEEYPPVYRVQGYHEMYGDNKLQWVDVFDGGARIADKLTFHTEMRIYTPDYRGDSLIGEGWWKDSGDFRVLDSYAMANGCVAEIVVGTRTYEDVEGETQHYIGTFMKDGILYKADLFVPVQYPESEAELVEWLHQILDSYR